MSNFKLIKTYVSNDGFSNHLVHEFKTLRWANECLFAVTSDLDGSNAELAWSANSKFLTESEKSEMLGLIKTI